MARKYPEIKMNMSQIHELLENCLEKVLEMTSYWCRKWQQNPPLRLPHRQHDFSSTAIEAAAATFAAALAQKRSKRIRKLLKRWRTAKND